MAEKEGFVGDQLTGGTSFSQLLFADDDDVVVGLDVDQTFNYCSSVFSSEKPPKMLCFGNYKHEEELVYTETTRTPQKSGVTCSDSSSASSGNNSSINTLSKCNKKRNESGQESVQCTSSITTTAAAVVSQRTSKKIKTENPTPTVHAKRKEKLGERITTLQQLVSPFGKTDTASVLHEAMGYIRFLHDQVQVLCSPYLQRLPSSPHHQTEGGEIGGEARKNLWSRGLCLVPVECTVHVANSNGADFWSPAMGSNVSSSSTKQ